MARKMPSLRRSFPKDSIGVRELRGGDEQEREDEAQAPGSRHMIVHGVRMDARETGLALSPRSG